MKDMEKVRSLLTELGVVYTEELHGGRLILRVTEGEGPKNVGYGGFITDFEFNLEGTFLEMGAWE